ncbi:hypothetical protein LTR05_007466 [Lithohypha guttulata]|uniref:Nephrocystin 3-like N-terminal domain-containing protein n=1 Tax=Lithohypha guttulata TaxID=1690604 RepID=A0AAN7SV35_9EURO|nr:hypothetical protein LTR05_007466 [Lithohypha guttulata]
MPATCRWLFEHVAFKRWSDDGQMYDHQGFFWLKGKPGCGKSTVMKNTLTWARKKWPKDIQTTVHYFFNARARGILEKSSLGLYRSVVHQIMLACPELKASFLDKFADRGEQDDAEVEWTENELQDFLVEVA